MSEDRPIPPVPKDCDLRGMPFMPLDLVRLFDSDLYALSTGEEFKAAITLWGKAFLQVPAGSLPKDPRILAHLSGVGQARWPEVEKMAMRGWYEAGDGRLYHAVVVEKAREAWAARCAQRARTEAARAARAASRKQHAPDATIPATDNVASSVTEKESSVTGSKGQGQGQGQGVAAERATPTPPPVPRATARPALAAAALDEPPTPDWQRALALAVELGGRRTLDGQSLGPEWAEAFRGLTESEIRGSWKTNPKPITLPSHFRAARQGFVTDEELEAEKTKRAEERAEAQRKADADAKARANASADRAWAQRTAPRVIAWIDAGGNEAQQLAERFPEQIRRLRVTPTALDLWDILRASPEAKAAAEREVTRQEAPV